MVQKLYQRSKRLNKVDNLPEFKVFWIISLVYAKSLSENIFGYKMFSCEPIFKTIMAHFRTNKILNINKIIFV